MHDVNETQSACLQTKNNKISACKKKINIILYSYYFYRRKCSYMKLLLVIMAGLMNMAHTATPALENGANNQIREAYYIFRLHSMILFESHINVTLHVVLF